MKKIISFLLICSLLLGMTGCVQGGQPGQSEPEKKNGKIGIITGTMAQSAEEYQTAHALKEQYGDRVVTATYPDHFAEKTEQTIAAVTNMASDPDVKVILFVQAIPGTVEAIEKVRESRDDILFICGVFGEDLVKIGEASDICIQADEISMGTSVVDQAAKQGAKTFVHISFERHLNYPMVAARRDLMKKRCEEENIAFVEAIAPDPTDESGVLSTHAWIAENIKDFVDQYGKDTAFFGTNCAMQTPLIQQTAELGAIYPLSCCPSPYQGYPEAFEISTEGQEDIGALLEQIGTKVDEYGNSGRMSTWAMPINSRIIQAGFAYGLKWMDGEITERCDEAALTAELKALTETEFTMTKYKDADKGELDNYFMISCPFYDF